MWTCTLCFLLVDSGFRKQVYVSLYKKQILWITVHRFFPVCALPFLFFFNQCLRSSKVGFFKKFFYFDEAEFTSFSFMLGQSLSHISLQPARLLCLWNSLGKNTGVGCHALLQGIFPKQGLNPGLLHYRQILYHLSYRGSLIFLLYFMLLVIHCGSLSSIPEDIHVLISKTCDTIILGG